MRITLVRHGETTGQSSTRYFGATDIPLSSTGRRQMRAVAAALSGERFTAVYSSRLRRSKEAAELIADGAKATAVEAFNEVDFGRWEGWTRDEIMAHDAEHYRLWQQSDESFCYPGGESRRGFRERVVAGLAAVTAARPEANVLMVLHKGVIAVILAELLRLPSADRKALAIDLGSIHVIARREEHWHALHLNRVDHLCSSPSLPRRGEHS
jgi:broad specificity phosphatase PhoE